MKFFYIDSIRQRPPLSRTPLSAGNRIAPTLCTHFSRVLSGPLRRSTKNVWKFKIFLNIFHLANGLIQAIAAISKGFLVRKIFLAKCHLDDSQCSSHIRRVAKHGQLSELQRFCCKNGKIEFLRNKLREITKMSKNRTKRRLKDHFG